MTQHRSVARWFAGLLVAGTIVAGAIAPADAVTVSGLTHSTHQLRHPTDTGWNGT